MNTDVPRRGPLPSEVLLKYWHLSSSFRNRGREITVGGLIEGFKAIGAYAEPRLLHNLAKRSDQQLDDVIFMRRQQRLHCYFSGEVIPIRELRELRIKKLLNKAAQLSASNNTAQG